MKIKFKSLITFGFVILVFLYGVGVGRYSVFPFHILKYVQDFVAGGLTLEAKAKEETKATEVAKLGFEKNSVRKDILISDSRKEKVNCPANSEQLGVLVTFGQSNSANYAEYMVKSEETIGVINWFDGSCYKAQSPLLGASGTKGEWISLLARELIQRGTYDNVIVVSLGIGGSPVAAWEEGSLLNDRLKRVLLKLKGSYKITDMLWQQGETDARWGIGSKSYFDSFVSLESSIRSISIDAPIFNSIGSAHCDNDNYPNRVTNAQLALVRERKGIVLGVNTDELITTDMRYDNCHFGESGQRTAASAAALIISSYHQLNK